MVRRTGVASLVVLCLPIWAACSGDTVGKIKPKLIVSPTCLDFGTMELGSPKILDVTLKDEQPVPVTVMPQPIDDDCGPPDDPKHEGCFRRLNPTSSVAAYNTYPLHIEFRPTRVAVATGTLTISSNGNNPQKVCLKGRGDDSRKPDICWMPKSIDMGFVPAGGIALGSFVVTSCGTNDLIIDSMSFDASGSSFIFDSGTTTTGTLTPGSLASVSFKAQLPATATGTVTTNILIKTNVVDEKNVPGHPGWVQIPVTAHAAPPPVALCGTKQTVSPWSQVKLDGSMSHPQPIAAYSWTLPVRPGGSQAQIDFPSSPMTSFWADLTGHYEAQLIVTDNIGLMSNPCVVSIDALPSNAIRIELTWDHPDSDLDLHLIEGSARTGDPSSAFCTCASDCHYRDCGMMPNWFPDHPGANPRLDIDDRMGFGPENINIDGDGSSKFVEPGTYVIMVHYYASNSAISTWPTKVSNATVRVYIYGLLAGEFNQALITDGDLWDAATIHWPEQTVTADGTLMCYEQCPQQSFRCCDEPNARTEPVCRGTTTEVCERSSNSMCAWSIIHP
jgi:hypothetical protein